jgi:hypothetical protein
MATIEHGSKKSKVGHRGSLEQILREVAFTHKKKFPELVNSALVRDWERVSGLKWLG